jgi:peptide/nickel transport system substrate-binding protein
VKRTTSMRDVREHPRTPADPASAAGEVPGGPRSEQVQQDRCWIVTQEYTMSDIVSKASSLKDQLAKRSLSRRRFAGASAGAVAAAMLTGGALPMGAGRVVMAQDGGKEFHAAYPYDGAPPTGHFNSFATTGNILQGPSTVYGDLIIEPLAMFYWESQTWEPLLATDWAFIASGGAAASPAASPVASAEASPVAATKLTAVDPSWFDGTSAVAGKAAVNAQPGADTLVVKLREGTMWADDTPITSKDLVDTVWCLRIMSNVVWNFISDAYAIDDQHAAFPMSVPATVVERYVIRQSNPRPSSIFGEWAQKARDLFGSGKTIDDDEGKQLLDQFNKFRPDKVIASGPFTIDIPSITDAQMSLVKNPKAWNVDKVAFDKIVNYNGETDTITPVVLAKEIDYATHGFAPASEKQMVAEGIRILRPPTYGGAAFYMNFGKLGEAFGDKRVRQGLAHAIDRAQSGTVSLGDSGVGVKLMAGFSDNNVPNWLSEADIAKLDTYDKDADKAAALLQEAGWTKDGDAWKTPDGNAAAFELTFPAEYADYSATGADLADQLTAWGIQATPRAVTYTQVYVDWDKGNFDCGIGGWGNSSNPHPHFSFVVPFLTRNYPIAKNNGGRGIDFPLEQDTEVAGKVNIEELVVDSAQGLDVEKQKAQVTTIAQVFNELLPCIPLYERYGNNAGLEGVRVVAWPPDDDPMLKQSPYGDGIPTLLMFTGKIEAV